MVCAPCTVHVQLPAALVGEGLAGLCQSAGRSVGRSAGRSLSVDHRGGGSCHEASRKEARRQGGTEAKGSVQFSWLTGRSLALAPS